jgi:hypothetical protein
LNCAGEIPEIVSSISRFHRHELEENRFIQSIEGLFLNQAWPFENIDSISTGKIGFNSGG